MQLHRSNKRDAGALCHTTFWRFFVVYDILSEVNPVLPEILKIQENSMSRQAILAVSFGTSYRETRERTIGAIERDIREAFPDWEVRRAFTSPTIIRVMRERDGIEVDNVEEALIRLWEDGFRQVAVQPTLVIRGFEYDRLLETVERFAPRFDRLVCGRPLLDSEEDFQVCAQVLAEEFAPLRSRETSLVFMGHGTEHAANAAYEKFQETCREQGLGDLLIGTVESAPDLRDMVQAVRDRDTTRVVLAPLMVVAGDHAANDMAGDEEYSWKSRFLQAGYEVDCVMRGLGEYQGIRRLYVSHAAACAEQLGEQNRDTLEQFGSLFGIGVGPGDPELITLKAVRTIRECDVIFAPGSEVRESVAYKIALQAVPELAEKICVGAEIPMVHDRARVNRAYDQAADQVEGYLRQGKQVGFLNLGDVTLYATYLHIHRRILDRGYQAELVNGVPSFCAAAAALNRGLAEGHEQFHILSRPNQVADGLSLSGTKVIMKTGSRMHEIRELLLSSGQEACLVENCGMEGQRIVTDAEGITGHEGYYSLLIVKERED